MGNTAVPLVPGDFVAGTIASITRLIRDKELKPGDYLPAEAALSEQFQVSRTVIREALRSLAALRLVDLGVGKRSDEQVAAAHVGQLAFGIER